MYMKRSILILAACAALLTGCHSFKDIKVNSFELTKVVPVGLSAIEAEVDVEIDNPTVGFAVENLEGLLKMDGDSCMTISSDLVRIEKKSVRHYTIPLHGRLADGFNPFQLLSILSSKDLSVFTIDVKAHGTLKGGIGKDVEYKDIPLTSLIDKL